MADSSGQAEIRGIDIDKLAKGFADEDVIFKSVILNSKTSNREIRWFQKTAGFLTGPTTTGITDSQIANTAQGALPIITGPSFTRNTSYVRKYMVDSEVITAEDIKDSDVDILGTTIRDNIRGVAYQVDQRIWNVITENLSPVNINTAAATGSGWDDTTNGNPILDIETGKQKIRSNGYKINNGNRPVLAMNSIEHKNLINWLITVKGSSIPNFSSEQIKKNVVMELLGCDIVVSETATTDYVAMWIREAATWKTFMPLTAVTIYDP